MTYMVPSFAVIPYRFFYLDGIQLSYLKVYLEIFHLWQANKPCFISNREFCKRTGLSDRTVFEALNYFEKMGELKRITKNFKRYIVQPERTIEIQENEEKNSSESNSSNSEHPCEIAHPPLRDSSPPPCANSQHNNNKNINIKNNKSSYVGFDRFWSEYPRKENKKGARDIWIRKKLEPHAQTIIDHIIFRKEKDIQWKDPKYIPHPTTFLNGERWTDKFQETSNAKSYSNNGQNGFKEKSNSEKSWDFLLSAARAEAEGSNSIDSTEGYLSYEIPKLISNGGSSKNSY